VLWIVYTVELLYLKIVHNIAETTNYRFEWGEGICRFLCPTEEQFGSGRCNRLPLLEFIPIRSVWLILARTKGILGLIGNGRVICSVWGTDQRQNKYRAVRVPSGLPPCTIEGMDVGGSSAGTASFPPTSLPSRVGPVSVVPSTLTSECRCEFL